MGMKDKITDLIIKQMNTIILNKIDFNIKKVLKVLKCKTKKEINNENIIAVIGNHGKVFSDAIIVKYKNTKDKVVILYSVKHEEPYFILVDTTNNENLKNIIDSFNLNNTVIEDKNYNNKTLQLNYILEKIVSFSRN